MIIITSNGLEVSDIKRRLAAYLDIFTISKVDDGIVIRVPHKLKYTNTDTLWLVRNSLEKIDNIIIKDIKRTPVAEVLDDITLYEQIKDNELTSIERGFISLVPKVLLKRPTKYHDSLNGYPQYEMLKRDVFKIKTDLPKSSGDRLVLSRLIDSIFLFINKRLDYVPALAK